MWEAEPKAVSVNEVSLALPTLRELLHAHDSSGFISEQEERQRGRAGEGFALDREARDCSGPGTLCTVMPCVSPAEQVKSGVPPPNQSVWLSAPLTHSSVFSQQRGTVSEGTQIFVSFE
ncbi:hypothetical protein P7K49_026034 [Saguinus oedipus]|uniref:Uncharacterized protein n=1 Tax=Saguinus oedipus TaxID=9490 RepID=A0ABQ9UJR1_SAGOE|nr:hypothetical protein P7K49_026034 [Saguinus oedipus]